MCDLKKLRMERNQLRKKIRNESWETLNEFNSRQPQLKGLRSAASGTQRQAIGIFLVDEIRRDVLLRAALSYKNSCPTRTRTASSM
jgi:hypothetical protein